MAKGEVADVARAAKEERNRMWREENAAAIVAYAMEVARDGLPLVKFRSFCAGCP